MALEPRKSKYRKQFRGKMKGVASANNEIAYGDFALKAVGRGWVNSREIEAARRAIVGHTKRKGRVWIKVFPDKPYTKKPTNSKMLGGKGAVEGYVAVVKPGAIVLELGGVKEEIAKEALRLADHKLSIKTRFIKKSEV